VSINVPKSFDKVCAPPLRGSERIIIELSWTKVFLWSIVINGKELQYLVRNKIAIVSSLGTAERSVAMKFGRPQSTLYLILLTKDIRFIVNLGKAAFWWYRGGLCSDVGLPRKRKCI
jgi:hypothetical protein